MKVEIEVDDALATTHKPVAIRKPKDGDIVRSVRTKQFYYYQESEKSQIAVIWEPIKQYREPVLPADYGKVCEFSNDGVKWVPNTLAGWTKFDYDDGFVWSVLSRYYKFARIEVTDEQN